MTMQILKKLPDYKEARYVSESMGEYIQIDIVAAGYTVEDLTIESRENGIVVVGNPKKTIGFGRIVRGFTNFFPIDDYKKFNREDIKAEIYNGIITIKLPVKEEFRAVKIKITTPTLTPPQ